MRVGPRFQTTSPVGTTNEAIRDQFAGEIVEAPPRGRAIMLGGSFGGERHDLDPLVGGKRPVAGRSVERPGVRSDRGGGSGSSTRQRCCDYTGIGQQRCHWWVDQPAPSGERDGNGRRVIEAWTTPGWRACSWPRSSVVRRTSGARGTGMKASLPRTGSGDWTSLTEIVLDSRPTAQTLVERVLLPIPEFRRRESSSYPRDCSDSGPPAPPCSRHSARPNGHPGPSAASPAS